MELATELHVLTKKFPKSDWQILSSQMNRAAISIPSNIAEGSNRGDYHFKHYLNISLGSAFELHSLIILAERFEYITKEKAYEMELKIVELQKMINGFINKLE